MPPTTAVAITISGMPILPFIHSLWPIFRVVQWVLYRTRAYYNCISRRQCGQVSSRRCAGNVLTASYINGGVRVLQPSVPLRRYGGGH